MGKYQKYFHIDGKVLHQLVTTENSCVLVRRKRKHLSLFPYHLNNVLDSIKEILEESIGKLDKELDGILLGYKKIKLLTDVGPINNESCYIHLDIEADFIVFKPVPGKELPAVVTKKSKNHVGCLVYHTFNISLPRPDEVQNWAGQDVTIGQEIQIRITGSNLERKLPYILGEIVNNTSLNENNTMKSMKINKITKFTDGEETLDGPEDMEINKNLTDTFTEEVEEDEMPKKPKKKKKRKRSIYEENDIES